MFYGIKRDFYHQLIHIFILLTIWIFNHGLIYFKEFILGFYFHYKLLIID